MAMIPQQICMVVESISCLLSSLCANPSSASSQSLLFTFVSTQRVSKVSNKFAFRPSYVQILNQFSSGKEMCASTSDHIQLSSNVSHLLYTTSQQRRSGASFDRNPRCKSGGILHFLRLPFINQQPNQPQELKILHHALDPAQAEM